MDKYEAKFWARVDKTPGHGPDGDCHVWNGAKTGGYGRVGKTLATHFALEYDGRPRPDGMFALHSCDYPPCVNPAHLRWGTLSDNTHDQVIRGRHNQRVKTHCPAGHPYTPENTLHTRGLPGTSRRPARICKACHYGRKAVKRAVKRENITQRARDMLAEQYPDDPIMAEKVRNGTCRNEDLNRAVKAVEQAIMLKKPHPTKALQAVLGEIDER